MISSSLKIGSAFALLAGMASCAPTSTPLYPPTSQSSNFRLVANVTSSDLTPSINGFSISSYHIGAGQAYAVLDSDISTSRILYVNGTASEVRYNAANLLSDEGTPLFPAGVSIDSTTGAVYINAGEGEAGVGLTQFPEPISELKGAEYGSFYACESELEYGSAVQLFYKLFGDATPAGCADVTLLPQCSEGSGAEDEFANVVECYADVSAIDWSIYLSS